MKDETRKMEKVYFFSKFWWGVYLAIAIFISLILLLVIFFPLGLSMASDTNFGINALISGVCADFVLRMILKKKMMISEKLKYSILFVWIPICIYVIVFQPLD